MNKKRIIKYIVVLLFIIILLLLYKVFPREHIYLNYDFDWTKKHRNMEYGPLKIHDNMELEKISKVVLDNLELFHADISEIYKNNFNKYTEFNKNVIEFDVEKNCSINGGYIFIEIPNTYRERSYNVVFEFDIYIEKSLITRGDNFYLHLAPVDGSGVHTLLQKVPNSDIYFNLINIGDPDLEFSERFFKVNFEEENYIDEGLYFRKSYRVSKTCTTTDNNDILIEISYVTDSLNSYKVLFDNITIQADICPSKTYKHYDLNIQEVNY